MIVDGLFPLLSLIFIVVAAQVFWKYSQPFKFRFMYWHKNRAIWSWGVALDFHMQCSEFDCWSDASMWFCSWTEVSVTCAKMAVVLLSRGSEPKLSCRSNVQALLLGANASEMDYTHLSGWSRGQRELVATKTIKSFSKVDFQFCIIWVTEPTAANTGDRLDAWRNVIQWQQGGRRRWRRWRRGQNRPTAVWPRASQSFQCE